MQKASWFKSLALGACAALSLAAVAAAADNGEPGDTTAPEGSPGSGYSLTYDTFSGTCSTTGFSLSATAHADLATDVAVDGHTTLNGAPYDTYGFGLSAGSYSFATGFSRTFGVPEPDATWQFAFYSRLLANGDQGTSITTVICTDGVLSATNIYDLTSTQEIPTLGQMGLIGLALLLGAGAIFALRRRTA